jgi:hypothetical protein
MKRVCAILVLASVATTSLRAGDEVFDRIDDALTWSDPRGTWRARLSGTFDLEGYALPSPVPALIDTDSHYLFNPRLAAFLDAQLGSQVYLFAQARADRGFDPAQDRVRARVDEYALRWTLDHHGVANLQAGKFATVVGNWTARHGSWNNPFITAPLLYENLTGVWDAEPPHNVTQLLVWAHIRPGLAPAVLEMEKYLRLPIIWGPSYATGLALAGEVNRFRYAVELKNSALSSRPATWTAGDADWDHPTVSGRVRYVPDERWEFGWSASSGVFMRPSSVAAIPAPYNRGDYRQVVLGQDVAFAWHHLQLWAEVYGARFKIPGVGNADTLAYYVESKYKFTPRFSGAVRWNQQLFGTMDERGTPVRWGQQMWRVDVAPAFRLSPHTQFKVQWSVKRADAGLSGVAHLLALQFTIRF